MARLWRPPVAAQIAGFSLPLPSRHMGRGGFGHGPARRAAAQRGHSPDRALDDPIPLHLARDHAGAADLPMVAPAARAADDGVAAFAYGAIHLTLYMTD